MPKYDFQNVTIPKNKFIKISSLRIEEKKFSFCFEFCSMKKGYICFNSPHCEPNDIIRLIGCLKSMSQYTISEIFEHSGDFRFHEVDLSHHLYLSEIFRKTLNKQTDEQLPSLWQLEIFTDNERYIAPRLTFYIQGDGVAKIVYYDYHHLLCSTIYAKDKTIPNNWFEHYVE